MNGKAPLSSWFWLSNEGVLVTPNYFFSLSRPFIERRL